jgi:S-DNA-T family DNA segregation ATPase FtsK/SpoIIIE
VDVITGVIKANFPCRIAFMVGSKTDSRTILDMNGAEMLLGRGDMLFSASAPEPVRIQGSLVTGREIRAVVDHWNAQDLPYSYVYDPESLAAGNNPVEEGLDSDDEVVRKAREIVIRYQLGSTSLLQRRLKVGYARAGRIMDVLEHQGVVGPVRAGKTREVLVSREEAGFIPVGEEGD